ncbi:siderophore-interacting protein [Phaeovulum sp. W22_SRMD_FR3]|uniref:siderophore-interacting protein n=1 Tax=Phaeovulum sp. W22_SRMD_FR3 TaxID=3240274 RepID=UPI003F95D8FD
MTEILTPPTIERLRHELRRRELTVTEVHRLTPHMLRVTLSGPDLADFVSAAPDDHVKLFLATDGGEPEKRDYTPRRFDRAKQALTLDFALHEAGPATEWALQAVPGGRLTVAGPRGSQRISGPIAEWLLIGDETALPAIGRRIEEMAAGTKVTALIAVPGAADEQVFETKAALSCHWLHRPVAAAAEAAPFLAALARLAIAPGTFVWIAAEASVARAVRSYLLEERGHPLPWLKAAGYWRQGQADAHEKIE